MPGWTHGQRGGLRAGWPQGHRVRLGCVTAVPRALLAQCCVAYPSMTGWGAATTPEGSAALPKGLGRGRDGQRTAWNYPGQTQGPAAGEEQPMEQHRLGGSAGGKDLGVLGDEELPLGQQSVLGTLRDQRGDGISSLGTFQSCLDIPVPWGGARRGHQWPSVVTSILSSSINLCDNNKNTHKSHLLIVLKEPQWFSPDLTENYHTNKSPVIKKKAHEQLKMTMGTAQTGQGKERMDTELMVRREKTSDKIQIFPTNISWWVQQWGRGWWWHLCPLCPHTGHRTVPASREWHSSPSPTTHLGRVLHLGFTAQTNHSKK